MQASAKVSGSRISFKKSIELAKQIRGKKLSSAQAFLKNLVEEKQAFDGKFYTTTAKEFLTLLNAAEANAKQKNLDTTKLFIKIAKADKGYKFVRPKSLAKYRGRKAKMSNLELIVEER